MKLRRKNYLNQNYTYLHMCMHFLNIHNIILAGDDIAILLN